MKCQNSDQVLALKRMFLDLSKRKVGSKISDSQNLLKDVQYHLVDLEAEKLLFFDMVKKIFTSTCPSFFKNENKFRIYLGGGGPRVNPISQK